MSSSVRERTETSELAVTEPAALVRTVPWTERPGGIAFVLTVDAIALFSAFAIGFLGRFVWLPSPGPDVPVAELEPYAKAWALGIYAQLTLFHAYGLYRPRRRRDTASVIGDVVKAIAISLLLILASSYFYRGFSYSRLSVVYTSVSALVLAGGFRVAWERYRWALRARDSHRVPCVIVGTRDEAKRLASRLHDEPSAGFDVRAIEIHDGSLNPVQVLAAIESFGAREVLVSDRSLDHLDLLELLETCERRGVVVRMVPATFDLLVQSEDLEDAGGIPLVSVNERRHRPIEAVAKRSLDISVALVGLILSAPVIAIAAIWIRKDSPGPAFFRQSRVGRDARSFHMWKLRSMREDADSTLAEHVDLDSLAEPVFKLDDDPRVTPVGRVLRRWSIDELPQLWNVLRGEMSLVGPRPEEDQVVRRYDVWERRRLKVKPGITGLQQIHCRGSKSLAERVRWDVLYVRRQSLLLDLVILSRTIGAVVGGRGAR